MECCIKETLKDIHIDKRNVKKGESFRRINTHERLHCPLLNTWSWTAGGRDRDRREIRCLLFIVFKKKTRYIPWIYPKNSKGWKYDDMKVTNRNNKPTAAGDMACNGHQQHEVNTQREFHARHHRNKLANPIPLFFRTVRRLRAVVGEFSNKPEISPSPKIGIYKSNIIFNPLYY